MKAFLPQVPSPTFSKIQIARVPTMRLKKNIAQTVRRFWRDN